MDRLELALLTDKCKADFEKWYLNIIRKRPDIQDRFENEHLLNFFWDSDDTMRNGYIIQFFDSKKIFIYENVILDTFDCEIKEYLTLFGELRRHCLNPYDTRYEAQKEAINRCNKIYNAYIED